VGEAARRSVGIAKERLRDYCDPRIGHMTDYEMIMIFVSFLTLLVMVSKKNNG